MDIAPTPDGVETVMVPLERIPTDEGVQMRVKFRAKVVREYAAAMKEQLAEGGVRFPPVVVFSEGANYWLADGFHRVLAGRAAGLAAMAAEVRPGSLRDAVLFGISANQGHGLAPSAGDKRKAAALLLADPEWGQWSDREIGRRCQVHHNTVSRMRRSLSGEFIQIDSTVSGNDRMSERKVKRGASIYVMKSAAIGTSGVAAGDEAPRNSDGDAKVLDGLGISPPELTAPVFAARRDFAEAKELFEQLATILDRIGQGPGGELYRLELMGTASNGQMKYFCPLLRICRNRLEAAEPYCAHCPSCHRTNPGRGDPRCKSCGGRGWTTRAAFDRCQDSDRQHILRLRANPVSG